jgi:hypothetical protein
MVALLLLFVLFGLFATVMWIVVQRENRQRENRHTSLAEIGKILGGGHDPKGSAWGSALGAPTMLRFTSRCDGSDSDPESWTEIDVDLPPAPFLLKLRRHDRPDRQEIDRGTMVDVVVGDPSFDEAFLVEAAPSAVVKVLLDAPTRTLLASYERIEVTTERKDDRPILRVAVRGWLDAPHLAKAAADFAVGLATRVRDAHFAAEQATPMETVGSPYRPMLDDANIRAAAAQRQAEIERIEQVKQLRAARLRSQNRIGWLVLVMLTIAWIALEAYRARRDRSPEWSSCSSIGSCMRAATSKQDASTSYAQTSSTQTDLGFAAMPHEYLDECTAARR